MTATLNLHWLDWAVIAAYFAAMIGVGIRAMRQIKTMDDYYISPLGSTYDDKYINGLSFNFPEPRGAQFYAGHPEDDNVEQGFFKVGDTIAVKFASIGRREFDFYKSYDENVASIGDIFSTPANVKSNITGGLGIWAGRGVFLDTIVCRP